MPTEEPVVLYVTEIAEVLGVGVRAIYDLVRSGAIPSRRIGRRFVIPRKAFYEWLNAGDVKEAAQR